MAGAIIFFLVLGCAVLFLIMNYYKNSQTDTKSSRDFNKSEENKSHNNEMDFQSFLRDCDNFIDNIDSLPISDETKKQLEYCYQCYGLELKEVPFSVIIQSDIMFFLLKSRIYTMVLNQQEGCKIQEYFEDIFPEESCNAALSRFVALMITDSDFVNGNISVSNTFPTMVFFSSFTSNIEKSDLVKKVQDNKSGIPPTWSLVVASYIYEQLNPFFEYGDYTAEDFEYENAHACLRELLKFSTQTTKAQNAKRDDINNKIESKQIEKEINIQNTSSDSDLDGLLNALKSIVESSEDKEKNDILDKKKNKQNTSSDLGLDDLLNELNSLIGLSKVKEEVSNLINLVKVRKLREDQGLKAVPLSLHLVFSGNPGTGKTTVARILAKIYKELGVLSKGQLIETDRSGLVAGYVGQTALKTQEVIEKAKGGILFIDEAYSLSTSRDSNDFGKEAIDTLLKAMEDLRDDFIVIVAGYPELMKQFLKSNPGLESRFNTFINFEDYLPEDLLKIFKVMCHEKDYIVSEDLNNDLLEYFNNLYSKRDESYANARTVRNFLENAMKKQANRLAPLSTNPPKKVLQELIYDDLF